MDLKKRFRNKTFVTSSVALLLVLLNQIGMIFGYNLELINKQITDITETIFLIFGLLGVFVDPKTEGITDGEDIK